MTHDAAHPENTKPALKSTCPETADFSELQPSEDAAVLVDEWMSYQDHEAPFSMNKKDCVCAHPCNGKQKHLHNGIKRAQEVFDERKATLEKSAAAMNIFNKTTMCGGLILATIGCPVIGLPIAAIGVGMQYLNKRTQKAVEGRFSEASAALHICEDPAMGCEDKKQAYGILKKASKHVRYWENSEYVVSTVVKFAVAEIALAVDVVMAAFDAKGEMERRLHPPKNSTTKLVGAIGEIHKGLGFKSSVLQNATVQAQAPVPN